MVASGQVIPAQCNKVVRAWLESPLGAPNGLVKHNLETHHPKGLYIARNLVQTWQEVPFRMLPSETRY
jgi:hypothetical protein